MAANFTKENKFVVAEGEEGELYIFIEAKKNLPERPKVIYDGKDHAVFLRSPNEKIILDYIHPEVREKLRQAPAVIMVETILENIKDSYLAEMQIVDNIPLDWKKIGLTTWEDAVLKS